MVTLELDKKNESLLHKMLKLYDGNFNQLFESIVNYRKSQIEKGINKIKFDLVFFENKYKLTTKDFYSKFLKGDFSDEENDFLEWSGEYEILQDYEKELEHLS